MNKRIKLLTALTITGAMLFTSMPAYANELVSIQDDAKSEEKSPKIENVNIDNFASDDNTTRAYVKALGEEIKYKFEILAEVVNEDGTETSEKQDYTLLMEGLTNNFIEWNNNDIKNIEGKTEEELQKEGKRLIYELKVTVSNEFGEDSCVTNYDPNLIPMRPESLYLISATVGNNVYKIDDNSVVYNCKLSDEVSINPTGFIYEGDKINYYVNDEKVESSDNNYTFKPTKAGTYKIKLEGISAKENESKEKYGIDNTMTITVNVEESDTNILKVAVNNKLLDNDQNVITCNTNQDMYFVGETGSISYYLYINDELVDKKYRNNEFNYTFTKPGEYNVKIVSDESCNGDIEDGVPSSIDNLISKSFKIVVKDKDAKAPTIKDVTISNTVTDKNNVELNVNCSGNDVKYTYEILRTIISNAPTGYWAIDFETYDTLSENNIDNHFEFVEKKFDKEYYEYDDIKELKCDCKYKLKITASNSYGYDVNIIDLDLNEDYKDKLIVFTTTADNDENNDSEIKDNDENNNSDNNQNEDDQNEKDLEQNKEDTKNDQSKDENKDNQNEEINKGDNENLKDDNKDKDLDNKENDINKDNKESQKDNIENDKNNDNNEVIKGQDDKKDNESKVDQNNNTTDEEKTSDSNYLGIILGLFGVSIFGIMKKKNK